MADREPARQWHTMLADALAAQDVVNVGDTVTRFLGRAPTRAEMNAARRAAHTLADSGHAIAHRVYPPELDRRGSARLVLVRPGATVADEARPPRDPAIDRHFSAHVAAHSAEDWMLTSEWGHQLGPWQLQREFRAARAQVAGLAAGFASTT